MKNSIKVEMTKETKVSLKVDGATILRALKAYYKDVGDFDMESSFPIEDDDFRNAKVQFQVPGGGDWSGTSIDVSEDDPVHVSWVRKERH